MLKVVQQVVQEVAYGDGEQPLQPHEKDEDCGSSSHVRLCFGESNFLNYYLSFHFGYVRDQKSLL